MQLKNSPQYYNNYYYHYYYFKSTLRFFSKAWRLFKGKIFGKLLCNANNVYSIAVSDNNNDNNNEYV